MSSDDRSNVRERLGRLFEVPFAEHGSRWDSLWQSGDLPFDRGCPNPAFVDALTDKSDLFGEPFVRKADGTTRRKRALVPGCGRGYDVLLLASFGYDAYGLEISPGAKQACETFAAEKGDEYLKSTTKHGFGSWKFLLGDFLKDSWQKEAGLENHAFDLIYDYTVSKDRSWLVCDEADVDSFCLLCLHPRDPLGPHVSVNYSARAAKAG